MFQDEQREILLPRIYEVRSLLNGTNCVSMNPFVAAHTRKALKEAFAFFAEDVRAAASELSKLTGVEDRLSHTPDGGKAAEKMVNQAAAGDITIEYVLKDTFTSAMAGAYKGLVTLEKEQKSNQELSKDVAKDVMEHLKKLHTVAAATPRIYDVMEQKGLQPSMFPR